MELSIWHQTGSAKSKLPLYIAVGGNTGSGKSTLLREISKEFAKHFGEQYAAIDERNFHHPLLTNMFFSPQKYSLNVQLNFLLQRNTYLFHALENQLPSVMERSHYEDAIFVEDHLNQGNITHSEYQAYDEAKRVLWGKVRAPDIYVRVLVDPDISIARIRKDEQDGKRDEEFPSDEVFRSYVERWYASYRRFFNEIDDGKLKSIFSSSLIFDVDTSKTPAESAKDLLQQVIRSGKYDDV